MIAYKEVDRFCISGVDVIVAEEGDEVVLLLKGYDLGYPGDRFKTGTPHEILEAAAELLVAREWYRGL